MRIVIVLKLVMMVAVLAMVGVAVATGAIASTGKPIGMVTGPQTGTYVRIGNDIASLMKGSTVQVQVKPSLGSIDNLRRMSTRTENAGLGIVQSDVLGFLKRSASAESQAIASKLRMVAPLFSEEVHVLARQDIRTIQDLQGKRVVVGTEGSGSMITAMNIFSLLSITPSAMYKVGLPEGVVAVLTGEADAAVVVGGSPLKLFRNLEELQGSKDPATAEAANAVHLLPLQDARLSEEYEATEIKAGSYRFVREAIPTIAVRAVLISYDFTLKNTDFYHARCAELGRVGRVLRSRIGALQQSGHPKWADVDLMRDVGLWRRDACAWPGVQSADASAKPTPSKPVSATKPAVVTKPASLVSHAPAVPETTRRLQDDLLRAMRTQ